MDFAPVIVVQARMGSTRLPGKVLAEVGGYPLLVFMLRRVLRARVPTIVATSTRSHDDPVEGVARSVGVDVHRGSEADVLSRVAEAVADRSPSHVVRVTADCPFADAGIVCQALEVARATDAHYVSNSLIRTFPDGLDVEVIRADTLAEAAERATAPEEREHVTPYVYRRPGRFRLEMLVDRRNLGHERWTVDTEEDLERIRSMVGFLDDPETVGWEVVLEAVGRSAPAPDLLPALDGSLDAAPASRPARRTWNVFTDDLRPVGWIGVTLIGVGRGQVIGDVPAPHRPRALAGLRRTLTADLQIHDLVVPDHWRYQ